MRYLILILSFLQFTVMAQTTVTNLQELLSIDPHTVRRGGWIELMGQTRPRDVSVRRFMVDTNDLGYTNYAHRIMFPGRPGFYLQSMDEFDYVQSSDMWGAFGTSTNEAPRLNALAEYCRTNGFTMYVRPRNYTNWDSVNINCQLVLGTGAKFYGNKYNDGMRIGDFNPSATNVLKHARLFLPSALLPTADRDHVGSLAAAVKFGGVDSCSVWFTDTDSYTYGLRFAPIGTNYVAFFNGYGGKFSNHKQGFSVVAGNNPSFTTQSQMHGGEFYSPASRYGTNAPGYYAVNIDQAGDGWTDANAWKFDQTSFEGGAWEYEVRARGRNNEWETCRFETGSPKTPRFLFWSTGSETYPTMYNHVRGATFYSKHTYPEFYQQGTADGNDIDHESFKVMQSWTPALGDTNLLIQPGLSLRNVGGGPAIGVFEGNVSPYTSPTNWAYGVDSRGIVAKKTNEAVARVTMNKSGTVRVRPSTGELSFVAYDINAASITDNTWVMALDAGSLYLKNPSDSNPRVYMRNTDGLIGMTDGTNPTDIAMVRTAAGQLDVRLGQNAMLVGNAGVTIHNEDPGDSGAFTWFSAYDNLTGIGSYSGNHSLSILKDRGVWRTTANSAGLNVWLPYYPQDFNVLTTDSGGATKFSLNVSSSGVWSDGGLTINGSTNVGAKLWDLDLNKLAKSEFYIYLSNNIAAGSGIVLTKPVNGPITISSTNGGTTVLTNASGSLVTVDGSTNLAQVNFTDSPEVNWTWSLPVVQATLIDYSIDTNRFKNTALSFLRARSNHTGYDSWTNIDPATRPTTRAGYGITDAHPLMSWLEIRAGTNVTVRTNSGILYVDAAATPTVASNSFGFTINGGSPMSAANAKSTPTATISQSSTNWQVDVADNSLNIVKLTTTALNYLLDRANHFGNISWSIITGTPTTVGGYGITDAQKKMLFTNIVAGANTTVTIASDVATISETTPALGTNIFVNGVKQQPARLTNNPSATGGIMFAIDGSGNIVGTATNLPTGGGGGGGGPYLPLSAGYPYPLTGSLQIWPSTRGFVSLWNGTDTAVDAGALEMSSGHLKLEQVSTNSLAVLQTFLDIDMSSDPMVVDFPDNVGHRQVTFHAPTTFYNDVTFGSTNPVTELAGKQPSSPNLTTLAGGNGSPITTGIAASAITSGTIPTNRLPATVAYTDVANTFTVSQNFSNTVTLGNMPLNYWFGSPMGMREWEMMRCTFNGSSVPTSLGGAAMAQQNVNGGGWSPTTSLTLGHPGVAYPFSAADNRAGGTGSFIHWNFNTSISINHDAMTVAVWQPYATNGVIHKTGWDTSLTMSDPTDACRWIATNGLMVAQNISGSVKQNGTNLIQLNGAVWYTTVINHTTNSSSAVFSVYTNGVLMLSETVSGYPLNRSASFVTGALGFTSASTNTSIALMLVDDVGYAVSTVGCR